MKTALRISDKKKMSVLICVNFIQCEMIAPSSAQIDCSVDFSSNARRYLLGKSQV